MNRYLELISDWANASENETFDKQYFFPSWHLDRIVESNRILAIGRKGAGKTALATHIASLQTKTVSATGVKLASLDLPTAGSQEALFGNFEALAKGWSKVILEAIAALVLDGLNLSPKDRKDQEVKLGLTPSSEHGGFIDRIRRIKLNASFLGVDVGLHTNVGGEQQPSVDQHNEALRDFIVEKFWSKDKKLAVVFDGLDEGYIQAWQAKQQTTYFRTLTALIYAAISEKNYFNKLPVRRQILPIVFLRSDIFEHLTYQQKAAWRSDQGVVLSWNDKELEEFCKFRVHQAAKQMNSSITMKDALGAVFQTQSGLMETLAGEQRKVPLTKYVVDYSLGRPRDIVMFMQAAAQKALRKNGDGKITKQLLDESRKDYGLFLKNEINDELGAEYPIVGIMLNRLAAHRKDCISVPEFEAMINGIRSDHVMAGDAHALAERLFDLGFFGHEVGDRKRLYALKDDDIQFNDGLPLCVHPCYAMAINLERAG